MKYETDFETMEIAKDVITKLNLTHVKTDKLICVRSHGSKSRRTIARIHGLPKIMQIAMNTKAFYVIEIISENFDKLSHEDKIKTIIHELCLPEDEWIVIKNKGELEIKKIGEFIEKEFNSAKNINRAGKIEWIKTDSKYQALSYDSKKHRVIFSKISKLMRRPNEEKKIIKIITRDGRKIKVSPNHPLLYTKNSYSYDNSKCRVKIKTCPAKDAVKLKKSHRLLELFALPKLGKNISEINLKDLLKKAQTSYLEKKSGRGNIKIENDFIRRTWVKGIKIPLKFKLDRELGRFFGFYLSEGSIDNKSGAVSFSFNSKETAYQEFVERVLKRRFGAKSKRRTLHNGNCVVIYANDKLLQFVIRDAFGFGEKSHYKKIPGFVYYAPLGFASGLVDGWFAGDGWVSYMKKCKSVQLSAFSKSPTLIFGILLLLARLKIVGRLRRDQHDIRIQTYFLPRFYKYCKMLIDTNNNQGFIDNIKPMKNIKHFKHTRYTRIRKIETEPYRCKYFYNMEVRPCNNFMHASGIFTHNCHIPHNFGGGFRQHRPYVTSKTVEKAFKEYMNSIR